MNSVFLVGKVGKDPEVRTIGTNGTQVASFSVATSRNQKYQGQDNWLTTWHNIKVWGKAAQRVNEEVRKGDTVAIHGRIEVEEWNDKDGTKKRKVVIVADSVVCSPKPESNDQGNQGNQYDQYSESAW